MGVLSPSAAILSRQARQIGFRGSSLISQPAITGISGSRMLMRPRRIRLFAWPRRPRRMKLWRESRALTICGTTVSSYPCTPGKSVSPFSMPRSRLRRSSSLTEREAPRGSKSGMRFNSPRVRGFERPEDCIDVPVMGSRSASRTSRLATS